MVRTHIEYGHSVWTASPVLKLNLSTITRGNRYKLDTHRTKYDLRKYFFTNRVVNVWNSLPDTVVMSETRFVRFSYYIGDQFH